MPAAIHYIPGQIFGHLTLIREGERLQGRRHAWFRCICGDVSIFSLNQVARGDRKSCGCRRQIDNAAAHTKHGRASSSGKRKAERTYKTWQSMNERCSTPTHQKWDDYGGRGIMVCDRWRESFANFLADMGEKPAGLSLDRIDNNGHYEPGNCRWATWHEQQNNRRSNRVIEFRGERLTITQISVLTGIPSGTIGSRVDRGWTIEDAATRPCRVVKRKE